MRHAWLGVVLALCASHASAYTLATSVSRSCHERLTFEAIALYLADHGSTLNIDVPQDRVTQRLMDTLRPNLPADISESALFAALSMIVGVRSPDTEGHSTLDLSALRRLHADPSAEGQYAHALRAPGDDGLQGDIDAIEGTKALIRAELETSARHLDTAQLARTIVKRPFFVDHYDTVQVRVTLAPYHLGRAIHVMQDAHAHMVRRGERYEHIVHVTNFVDAVNGTLKTSRDGLAHSDALDDCNRDDVAPIFVQARARTVELVRAFDELLLVGSKAGLDRGLSACPDDATRPETCGWIEYEPLCAAAVAAGDVAAQQHHCCTAENAFCRDTVPAMAIAREDPAEPYLGCAAAPGQTLDLGWMGVLMALLGVLIAMRPRRAALMALCLSGSAHAEAPRAFIAGEGHFAALSDTPRGSIVNMAFGYSARFGYRFGRWRVIGMAERSYWVPLEYGVHVDPGVLNLGVGVEALFFDDYVRIGYAVGPSILMFDAVFDDAGTVGYFVDIRPAGLRFAVAENVIITFDPVAFSLQQPVVRDPPIRKIHRRLAAGLEWQFL